MEKATRTASGKWRIKVLERTDPDGTRHYKSFTAPKKKEVEMQAMAFIASLSKTKQVVEVKPSTMSFKAVLSDYIASKDKIFSPSTLTEFRAILKRGTSLDDMPVSEIDNKVLQKCINDFSETHSPKTTKNFYSLIVSALKFENPEANFQINLPPKRKITYSIPSEIEVKKMIASATGELKIAILLAVFCPARRGEICAVKYGDIKDGVLHIHADIVRDGSQYVYKATPKSNAGDRYIALPDKILREIGEGNPESFIVKASPHTLYNRYSRLCASLGMHYRFHDLRHYGASLLHTLGVPDAYIMQRGGWGSDATLKGIYLHALPEHSQKFAEIFNKTFNNFLV